MTAGALDDVEVEVVQEARPAIDDLGPMDEEACYHLAQAAIATGAADDELMRAMARHRGGGRGAGFESFEESAFGSLWDAVRALFARTRTVERGRRRERWRWPLFVFGAADVDGVELEGTLGNERSAAGGWSFELFGSGMERKATITVSQSFQMPVARGEIRLWFVEHDVDVVELEVQRGGKVSVGHRLELVGNRTIRGELLASWPAWATPLEWVESLGYRALPAAPAIEWSQTESRTSESSLVLGLDLKPLGLGATGNYQVSRSLGVRASLPGGHDWEIARPAMCPGILVRSTTAAAASAGAAGAGGAGDARTPAHA